jgi:hypothetical protein
MQSKFPLKKTPLADQISIPYIAYYFVKYNKPIISFERKFITDEVQLRGLCKKYYLNYNQICRRKQEKVELIDSYNCQTKNPSFGKFIEIIKARKELSRQEKQDLIKVSKTYRHEYTNPEKNWQHVLPKEIRQWAWERFDELAKDCDCVDNQRVARCNKSSQIRRYKRNKDQGCCGFFDTKELCPIDNNWYLLGFNHGH